MADNLIQLEQDVEAFIDPNGVAGSILAQNHQDILKSVLNKVGKYVGSPYLATKNETNLQPGLMSWRGNVMNNTNQFQIDFAKLTADLNDFGLILETLAEGDLIHFKDSKGRSVFLEFVDFAPATNGGVDVYEVDVKGKAENINYVYQDNERLISVLQSYKQNSAGAIYEIQFNAPNFVLLENGVPKTSIDLSIAITDTIQATETSLVDFATNSANYTFQQGDVISIVTNPDNILELYLYKSGTKTDVNNYQKIDASKIDWSNILNKPDNLTNIEIQDENGVLQFTLIDLIRFSPDFEFDSATKKISLSPVIARTNIENEFLENQVFKKIIEIHDGGTSSSENQRSLLIRGSSDNVETSNPRFYELVSNGRNVGGGWHGGIKLISNLSGVGDVLMAQFTKDETRFSQLVTFLNGITPLNTLGVKNSLEIGSSGGSSATSPGNRLRINPRQENQNPNIYEIMADSRLKSTGWLAQLILGTYNGSTKVDGITIKSNGIDLHLPVTFLAGFVIQKIFLDRIDRDILEAKKVGRGGFNMYSTEGGGVVATVFENISSQPTGGWNGRFVFKINHEGQGVEDILLMYATNPTATEKVVYAKANFKMDKLDLSALGSYADDATAGSNGVAVGQGYINSATGALHRRLS